MVSASTHLADIIAGSYLLCIWVPLGPVLKGGRWGMGLLSLLCLGPLLLPEPHACQIVVFWLLYPSPTPQGGRWDGPGSWAEGEGQSCPQKGTQQG